MRANDAVGSSSPAVMFVGVDGCRAGWIAVAHASGGLTYRLHANFAELLASWRSAERILVDIPIGLPWRNCPSRPCDRLARQVLAARAPSVFSPPSRRAYTAATIGQAREWNLEEVGRSLSAQAWGICKKIAEVDHILLTDPAARQRVMEVHPEVCFWALNGGTPMRHRKSRTAGVQERLATILSWEPDSAELLAKVLHEQLRSDVTSDDVLDALVALITADAEGNQFATLPQTPGADDQGLPMQMVYRNPRAAQEPSSGIRVQASIARPSSRHERDDQPREDS